MSPKMQDIHQDISELLPWYANNTLSDEERARIDAHLETCAACRADLRFEQQVFTGLHAQGGIEYMPAASLKKLQSRLDSTQPVTPLVAPAEAKPLRRMPWTGVMAASVAALAIAVSMLAADRLMQRGPGELPGSYVTVTTAAVRPPDEVIRAVFAQGLTLEQLQVVLDGAQLRIVSGPTEAGVYSLATISSQSVTESLATLRQNPAVRFAETTRVVTDNGRVP